MPPTGNADTDPNRMIPRTAYRLLAEKESEVRAERDRLRDALLVAADDLDKAANQFAGMVGLDIALPVVNNPDIFAAKAARAREAAR